MKVTVQVRVAPQLQQGLRNHPSVLSRHISAGLDAIGVGLASEARMNATSRPRVQTGRLRRSIDFERKGYTVVVGSNVVYARIQEYGGVIKPRNSRALRFRIGDRLIVARQVTIKKKEYLGRALRSYVPTAEKLLYKVVVNAARECGYQ